MAVSSMLTFRVLPHWNIITSPLPSPAPPTHMACYSTQSNYTDTGLTSSDSKLYFLNAECKVKEQLVPFLNPMVWLSLGSNTHPPRHKVDCSTNLAATSISAQRPYCTKEIAIYTAQLTKRALMQFADNAGPHAGKCAGWSEPSVSA